MAMKLEQLDPETLKKLGLVKPRNQTFLASDERRHAITVLNVISDLSQDERKRVLRRAEKMNSI